jgi:hypothetical protein
MSKVLRILHLEDDVADAELVRDTLEIAGMSCDVTRVETEARFCAALQNGEFDLVLADYTLPSFDGLSALNLARQRRPELPFIFVSGTLGEEVSIEALKIGATDYVLKTRLARLVPSVQRALGEGRERAELRRAEAVLREQANLLNLTHDTIFVMDMEGVIKYWNRGAEERYGWTAEQAVGKVAHDLLMTVFPAPLEQIKAEVTRTHRWEGELVHTKKDGTQIVVASRWSLQRDDKGAPVAILETNNDITERKRAEESLSRLNRELRAISNCNQTLLRATDEQSLLDQICRIVCEEAGYRMAYVSFAEHDEAKSVHPVAWAGAEEGYFASAGITWADTERGRGHTGTAIRSGKTCCIQDFATDPRMAPWREGFLQRGFRSGIGLPLKDDEGRAFGSLTVHSAQPDAFTPEEIRLLEELAGDMAFGIVNLRSQAAHKQAQQEVTLLSFALDHVREAAFLTDDTGRFDYVNEEACRVLGYTREELLGMAVADINPEFPVGRWPDYWRDLKAKRSLSFESRHRARDGRLFPVEISANYFEYGGRAYNLGLVRDITERKRAEEKLQRSEAYLAESQRLTHTGSFASDATTLQALYCSQEDYRIWDLDPQQGPPTLEMVLQRIHPEDRGMVVGQIEKGIQEGTDFVTDFRIVLPDGTVKYIHAIVHPVFSASGDVREVIGTHVDVTERKRAEEALRRSEGELRQLVDVIPQQVFVFDVDWSPVFANRRELEYTGITPDEAKSKVAVARILHPEDLKKLEAARAQALSDGAPFEMEARIRGKDGGYRWFLIRDNPLRDEQGRILRWYGTRTDIEERKRAEEALRRSEAYLAEAQRLTHTGSWAVSNMTGEISHSSEEHSRLYGFDPERGTPSLGEFLERFHPEDRARVLKLFESARRAGKDFDMHHRVVLPDGTTKYLYGTAHPVINSAGDVTEFVGSIIDVTERKRAEEQRDKLRQLEADLAQINRVSMLGELSASISHELNQPIAASILDASLAMKSLDRDPPDLTQARQWTTRIIEAGTLASEIISRLRSLYKKEPPKREPLTINEVIGEMVGLLRAEATRYAISVRADLAESLPIVVADRVQIQQVLMNLMLNAIEAMSDTGGVLTVKSQLKENGQIEISVSDTGPGLPPGKAGQIFDAFFTTKPQGSGMGLAISKSIVESHGGCIWANGNGGRGATFHLTLPAAPVEADIPVIAK